MMKVMQEGAMKSKAEVPLADTEQHQPLANSHISYQASPRPSSQGHMAQMCPGPATRLYAQDKTAEAKTHPDMCSGGASAYLTGEVSQTLNAEPPTLGERFWLLTYLLWLLICFVPAGGGEEQRGVRGRVCSG